MKRVYFIKPIGMDGPIKIGCSRSPENRRNSLETWSPFPLEVLAEIAGDFDLERRFHHHFLHLHQRREWFNAAPELMQVIDSINAGTFNIDVLPGPMRVDGRREGPRQRPSWIPVQMSISLRVPHMGFRSGFHCPIEHRRVAERDDALAMSIIEAYLADPAKYGVPSEWGAERRAQFLAGTVIRRHRRQTTAPSRRAA